MSSLYQCVECGEVIPASIDLDCCLACGGEVIKATEHASREFEVPEFTPQQRRIAKLMRSNRGLEAS